MAKNVSREYATMDDEERRRYALQQHPEAAGDAARELDFPPEGPRDPDHMGRDVQPDDPDRPPTVKNMRPSDRDRVVPPIPPGSDDEV